MFELIILIIVLGVLIFVHELGHFIIAKRLGMKVKEFGFGFPPRIFGIKKGETVYSINWIPFGGFVSILGEDGGDKDNSRSFSHATPGPRAAVIIAGVIMNVLLAFVLFSIINTIGARTDITGHPAADRAQDIQVNIGLIADNSPAKEAGFEIGDSVLEMNFQDETVAISEIKEVQDFVELYAGQEIVFTVDRQSEVHEIAVVPRLDPPEGEGAIGIAMVKTGIIDYPIHQAIIQGGKETGIILWRVVQGFGMIFRDIAMGGGETLDQVSGPVGIAVISGQAARLGFTNLMFFTAVISLNLAILNILPIPPLDGGKLLFIIIEKLRRGKEVAKKVEQMVGSIGFLLLIALVIYVTVRDVIKFL